MHIFFYIHAWHHLQNIEPVIREMERRNVGYTILIFVPRDDNYPRVERLFPAERIKIFAESRAFRIGERLSVMGKAGKLLGLLWSFLWLLAYFARRRPSRLAVTEDTTLWSNLLIGVSRLLRVKRVHLPNENIIFVDGVMEDRCRQGQVWPEHPDWLHRLARRLYPVNVQPYQGKLLYWYGAHRLIASYFLGLLPATPWVRGSNHIDCVAVNSRVQFEENARYGLDAARQAITGFPMHDQLAACLRQRDSIKARILEQVGQPLAALHPIERGQEGEVKICLIIGTAPRFLWTENELPAAYIAHGEMLRALHEALGDGWRILVKVHPREDREAFIEKVGAKDMAYVSFLKTEFSVYELMAASDLVIMFKSSTVIAAFALDVPVLAYGIHSLHGMAEFYDRYPSIDQVYSLDEMRARIKKMGDTASLDELKRRRAQDREQYGMFDGKNTERVVETILR